MRLVLQVVVEGMTKSPLGSAEICEQSDKFRFGHGGLKLLQVASGLGIRCKLSYGLHKTVPPVRAFSRHCSCALANTMTQQSTEQ